MQFLLVSLYINKLFSLFNNIFNVSTTYVSTLKDTKKNNNKNDEKEVKALHGLYRKLIANMVEGVSKGFEKGLVLNGVGYKVAKQGKKIVLSVGYSHPVEIEEVPGITFECPSITEVVVKGIDKELVGQMAANIRKVRNPDPYHAYGIRYKDEVIVRKEGKTGKK